MAGEERDDRGKLVVETGEGRTHVESPLMMESLVDKGLIRQSYAEHETPIVPDAHLVHLGGQSIVDHGASVVMPIIEEIVAARKRHKMVIGVGGGVRERHTYAQCIDLGLPTGALAQLTGVMCKQNATMIYFLLAQHGGVRAPREEFPKLPFYLEAGAIPVIVDLASYHFWEHLGDMGRIPPHRPDTSALLLAEVYSFKSCIFVKDVDGIHEEDPRLVPDAPLIRKISVDDLLARELPDLPIERAVLETLQVARNRTDVRIVNGHVPGELTRALDGEDVGTLVHR